MKNETKELLGFNVQVTGICETLQECIEKSGSEEAVRKDYINNVLAHSHYTILRRNIVSVLVKETGLKQKTMKEKTGDKEKEVIIEKDAAYIARLETELGSLKQYESKINSVCAAIPVDYTPGTRGAGGAGVPAKKWLAYYDQLVTEEKLDAFCQKYEIDGSMPEDELKFAVAGKVREIVVAQQEAAAQAALNV